MCFMYEVMFYEAWPQNKGHNLTTDKVYFYTTWLIGREDVY